VTVRQQWLVVLGVVAVLASALWGGTVLLHDELHQISVGDHAPEFSAVPLFEPVYPSAPGDTAFSSRPVAPGAPAHTLASYKGQVVLLNIWATWCEPCRAEMPAIEQLHRQFGPRGLRIVAVSVDNAGDVKLIDKFVRDFHLSFEILHDAPGAIQRQYRTTGVPETFVLGKDGVIRKKVIGAADWSSQGNRALIAQLLAEDTR
jgi:thiol-disulfide isomerase/thioredoxin